MSTARAGRSIVLVGMMGVGKTTVARILGGRLSLPVLDTDELVERACGKPVSRIFADDGEDAFREMEMKEFRDALARKAPCVIAAAGGIVVRDRNREVLLDARARGHAVVIWLRAGVDDLVTRTASSGHRPLLGVDREGSIRRLTAEREAMYALVCDSEVDTTGRSADEVADDVLELLSRC